MSDLRQEFIVFSVKAEVLKFGEFTTMAGRQSPYFFNADLFHDGATLGQLAQFYAQRLFASNVEFDMPFGPAFMGITLGIIRKNCPTVFLAEMMASRQLC